MGWRGFGFVTSEPEETSPSPDALEVAALLRTSARNGLLRPADLNALREALEECGVQVLLPPRGAQSRGDGWLEARPRDRGRGPRWYVYHVRQDGRRRAQTYLGVLGKAKAPEWLSARLSARVALANARMDTRFLHDD